MRKCRTGNIKETERWIYVGRGDEEEEEEEEERGEGKVDGVEGDTKEPISHEKRNKSR